MLIWVIIPMHVTYAWYDLHYIVHTQLQLPEIHIIQYIFGAQKILRS